MLKSKLLLTTSLFLFSTALHASLNLESEKTQQSSISKKDDFDLHQSFYKESKFDLQRAQSALFHNEIDKKSVNREDVLDVMWTEALKGSNQVQEKLYTFFTKKIGMIDLINSHKAKEVLKLGLDQQKGWAYRIKAQQFDLEGDIKQTKKYYCLSAYQMDEVGTKEANRLFDYNPTEKSLLSIENYIQYWKNQGYAIPLYSRYQKENTISFLIASAELGYPVAEVKAQFVLGFYYEITLNEEKAYEYYLKAADQGWVEAQYNAAHMLRTGFGGRKPDLEQALKYYLKAADQGFVEAQHDAAVLLNTGFGGRKPDHKKALKYFLKAADQGLAIAQHNVAYMLQIGFENRKPDLEQALKYYLKAADQGWVEAQYNAALLLNTGFGGRKPNHKKALKYFLKAADQGLAIAQNNAAFLLQTVFGDLEKTFKYYLKAADQGLAAAQHSVAHMLRIGFGNRKPDHKEAFKYYLKAADQGLAAAQHSLSWLLIKEQRPDSPINEGVIEWLNKAIAQDHVLSMLLLGDYYMNFEGEQEKALFWLEKSKDLELKLSQKHLDLIEKVTKSKENTQENSSLDTEIDKLIQETQQFIKKEEENFKPFIFSIDPYISVEKEKNTLDEENKFLSLFKQEVTKKPIFNPKYRRAQMVEAGKLRKEHEKIDLNSIEISPKSKIIIKNIEENRLDLNDLYKLFNDPYFKNQVVISNTKSGVIISAHHRVRNQHITTSTHHAHHKNQNQQDLQKAFLNSIRKILEIFDLDV